MEIHKDLNLEFKFSDQGRFSDFTFHTFFGDPDFRSLAF